MVLISNSDCISVTIRDNIYGDWSGQTYKIAKSDSLKHIFQHYSGKCEIQLPRFAFDVHDDLSIDCQQSPSDLGIKNNDKIWVLSCITKSKRFGCHDGTVRYYSHFSGWSRVSSLFSEEVLGLDMLATFGTSTQMLLKLHNDHHRQKIDYEIEKNKEEIRLTNSSNGSPTPAPMEVDNEAEVVGATGVEFEVEDVPLEEDREFCRTILSPENNLRPTGDEWIVPIVLFPEPGKATNKEVDQVKPTSTVPMEVEQEHQSSFSVKSMSKEVVPSEDRDSMDVDVGVHESNDTKMEVEEDTAIDGKEKNRVRMAMQETRKDAEYRKKERDTDSASKKRKRDSMSQEEKDERNRKKREHEKRKRDSMSQEEKDEINRKKREHEKRKKDSMSQEEKDEINRKKREHEKRKRDSMSQEEKDEINRKKRERANVRRVEEKKKRAEQDQEKTPQELEEDERMADEKKRKATELARVKRAEERMKKALKPKGYINNEEDWLVKTQAFLDSEKVADVSDGKYRDENGRHYLGEMNVECGYCGALGFQAEVQGTFPNPNDPEGEKLVHFGSLCCCKGKVNGISDYNLPEDLEWLYTSDDPMAVHFRENSRTYNNGMAMSSITATKGWRSRTHNNKMESMLTSGGQLFRRVGSMLPVQGEQPKCVQTYFYGGDEATKWRILNTRRNMNRSEKRQYTTVFNKLNDILTGANNTYIKSFLGVKEYVETHLKDKIWDVKLSIHANETPSSLKHKGRLNAPSVNEIAILLPSDDVITKNHKRYVTVNYRQKGDRDELQFIPDYHRSYDPLQYPLIFPRGQDGWHCDLKHTCLQHTNFMLMDRKGIVNPILCGRSLGQQYIVDQFAKAELSRLNYIECNQKEMRAEVYSGAKDAMKSDKGLGSVGKRVVLPSSFTGGDRYMHQQYLDSIGLYQRFSHPHLFITMTCNPYWPEIQDYLEPGQTALDRPDLVSRVFNLKKRQLIKDLGTEMIFGMLLARTHSIEFQKRGFPHAHIIIWLKRQEHQSYNLTTEEIDQIICAEIPNEYLKQEFDEPLKENPLFKPVTDFMMHGPCDPTYACMSNGDGYCRYGFPKDYQSITELSEDAYPLYRRRSPEQGGNSFSKYKKNKRIQYTNANVVPYNKYLLFKYNCHINVEFVHSVNAIKYHLKYINKGSDQANVTVESSSTGEEPTEQQDEARNEVRDFQTKRYISGAESTHRFRGNEVAERKPTVSRLQLHLPGEQTVYFDANNKDQSIERIERSERTKLTAFFELNNEEELAQTLLYREIPEHYTWDSSRRKWNKRKQGNADGIPEQIGRMYSIHPTQIQLFALRLLLNHVRGPLGYEDIKEVDGFTHETFQDAAIANKLVKDDKIWIECMNEANESETNIHRLRKLFVIILTQCEVSRHKTFYKKCKDLLSADYLHQYKVQFDRHPKLDKVERAPSEGIDVDPDNVEDYDIELETYTDEDEWTLDRFASNSCLIDIERILGEVEKSLSDFGLPLPNMEKEQYLQNCLADHYIAKEDDFSPEKAKAFFEANYPKLNEDQRFVLKIIQDLIENDNRDGKLLFLDAPGGTGKTFTLNVLVSWIRMENREVATSASSGIAATLLYLGRTAHNRFKLPFHPHKDSVCNIKKQSDLANYLTDIVLAIIDEGPMLNKLCFEALDRSMRDLASPEDRHKKFGGKLVLVSGDFRQLLPVIEKANRAKIVGHTLKHSKLWDKDVMKFRLTHNMRVQNEMNKHPNDDALHEKLRDHEQWLLKLGEGKLPSEGIPGSNIIEVPSDMCLDSKDDVVEAVFNDFEDNIGNADYFKSRVLLAATNEIVNEVNNEMVGRIPGDAQTFHSIDTVGDVDSQTQFPTEFLNSLSLSGMPEHELKLKLDTVVILLRNIDIKGGHCNGTRYLVKHIGQYRLVLHKLDYKEGDKNKILILPRIPLRYGGQSFPFELTRLQFPIKIAFALTINRAQGQSVTTCGILLPKNVWTHGQIYVAFSRCGNPNNLYVWAEQSQFKDYEKLDPKKTYVKNVVYQEVIGK